MENHWHSLMESCYLELSLFREQMNCFTYFQKGIIDFDASINQCAVDAGLMQSLNKL